MFVTTNEAQTMDKQSLKLLLGQGLSVERIAQRFGRDPSTISCWMKQHGLESPFADKHAAKGGIERGRLEGLVDAGKTIAEIAEEVGVGKTTVRYWLRRYGLKTKHRSHRTINPTARASKDAGRLTVVLTCKHHGQTEFTLEGRGYYRCKRCRADAVSRRRRRMKEILVKEAGGCCCICGYSRCLSAVEFHHLDPTQKRLAINAKGVSLALATLRIEARKCVLLCSNCHAEVEAGMATVPATVPRPRDPPVDHNPIH
jgi:transposase-like protein